LNRAPLSATERAALDQGGEGNENLALKALVVGQGLNIGNAVMASLVPAIHAAPAINLSPVQTSVSSDAYDEAAVFWWMAGASPAMTENQNPRAIDT